MTGFATLTSKNQLTLPVSVVDFMALTPGVQFWVEKTQEKIILEKVSGLRDVQGVLVDHPKAQKHTADEVVRLARKKKIARLYGHGS